MSDNSEEKTEQASRRKLRKQREQGSLPRTSDISSMLNVVVGLVILVVTGASIFSEYKLMFDQVYVAIRLPWDSAGGIGISALVKGLFGMTMTIVIGTLVVMLLVSTLYQGGLPFSLTPLVPDFKRLNPAQGFQRIFGRRSWIEVVLHLSRALVWLGVCALVVWTVWSSLFRIDLCGDTCGIDVLAALVWRWVIVTFVVLGSYLGIEMLVQHNLYMHEQKMSKSDVKRENKDQTGAPELRNERNRLRKELAKEAENADKSLSNMCFYFGDVCVGLRYHPQVAPMPRVTAKAKGEEAVHLRRYIIEQGYPSMAHEKIAQHCSRVAPGAPVGKDIFEDLAKAMTKMFAPPS